MRYRSRPLPLGSGANAAPVTLLRLSQLGELFHVVPSVVTWNEPSLLMRYVRSEPITTPRTADQFDVSALVSSGPNVVPSYGGSRSCPDEAPEVEPAYAMFVGRVCVTAFVGNSPPATGRKVNFGWYSPDMGSLSLITYRPSGA